MIRHSNIGNKELRHKIRHRDVLYAGNSKLKIYGTFDCKSGKKMKRENRVFFLSLEQLNSSGYRPCGHCMRDEYQKWIYLAKK